MNRLFEDNRDFNQQLTEKFNRASSVNSFLTPEEKDWLSGHETIRVGYRNNFLPFCDLDEETQSLTGFLADYLEFAQTAEKNAQLSFDTTAFATTGDALQALERGEIDCIFPLNLSSYDGEKYGVIITDPLVSTEMYAVVRTSDGQGISRDRELTVAVIHDNPNYNTFQMDYFPSWEIAYYDNTESAFQAVADGKADAGLVSNYRISLVSDLIEKNKLAALTTGEVMDVSFAVRQEDDCLYSILNKITGLIPDATVNSLLTNYSLRENRITFREFILDNLIYFIIAVAVVAVVILLLVIRNLKIQAKEEEGRQIISEAERDPLTGLYNWNFFLVYAGRLYNEHPEKPMDAVVININRFHSVNALHGREFGDNVLRTLGEEINNFLLEAEGIASRFEADRFDIYCAHRDDWQTLYDRFQARLDSLFHNASIHLRMGVKPWQDGMDTVTQFDCARTACNSTRGDYKARAVIYDDIMGQREERDQKLLSDLSRALEQHELEVYYQPKYNIQAPQPKLASAEALVRWRHPELGLISPDEFIPLYEQSGQISVLDSFVWEAAARQIADWKTRYGTALPVSVNVSRVDVFDPALESILEGLVSRYGLNHSELKLEITESAYTENAEQLIQVIGHLREKGYEIEMDDFGSGYSSLNMLSSMPIDILKMDIAFIRNIEQSEKDFHLVELIIDIARYLKVPVIAEGVENENQLRLLKDAGCDLVQGYYFSRPLPVDEFERKILGF
jgi:EAL domain-containing protein (putative c-di-GMP-specific phosphodiesterase class I)/GGDEF domain-containing protein/ABC-type amino acid transport substrate-binding protein